MKKLCDLHTHSTASDGSLTPTELVALAKQTGLAAIVLSDHNTVEGLPEFLAAGEKYGVELPITSAVYEVCYGESDLPYEERCKKAMAKFFVRETKTEFYS